MYIQGVSKFVGTISTRGSLAEKRASFLYQHGVANASLPRYRAGKMGKIVNKCQLLGHASSDLADFLHPTLNNNAS